MRDEEFAFKSRESIGGLLIGGIETALPFRDRVDLELGRSILGLATLSFRNCFPL